MTKYVKLGTDNRAVAFYDSALHTDTIPSSAIEIADELWQSWLPQTNSVIYVAATQSLAIYTPTYTAAQLTAYASAKLQQISNGGVTINVGTASQPLNVSADTSADGKSNLSGILQGYTLGVLTGSYTWYQASGSLLLTEAQLQAVSTGVMSFVASVYATWQAVMAAIGTGTITTTAQIDIPPASIVKWPVNS
jgi:hypothetical protein